MKFTWRKFFYLFIALGSVVILVASYLMYLIRAVPESYEKELSRPPVVHQEPVQELLEKVDDIHEDIRFGADLDYEFTQDQLNAWLATQLTSSSEIALPSGIENPRVVLRPRQQTLYFTLEASKFSSAISIELGMKLAEQPNAVELKLQSIHAGKLPISLKRVFDEIESAMDRSGVNFQWKPGTDRTVAIVQIPSKVRVKRERELTVTALEFLQGKVRVTAEVD